MISPETIYNSGDGALVDAEAPRDISLGTPAFPKIADLLNVAIRKDAAKFCDAVSVGVQEILQAGTPFKVGYGVVGLNQINVVNLSQILGVGDERKGHKAVDRHILLNPIKTQKGRDVAARTDPCGHFSRGLGEKSSAFAALGSVFGPHISEIADLENISERVNGDGSPLLDNRNRHALNGLWVTAVTNNNSRRALQDKGGTLCR